MYILQQKRQSQQISSYGSHLGIFQYNVRKLSQAKEKAEKRNSSIKNNNNNKKTPPRNPTMS